MTHHEAHRASNWDEILSPDTAHTYETPMRKDAFALSDDQKVSLIAEKFTEIMEILGLDLTDDSLSGTPERVAKMYVHEAFSGLNPANFPDVKLFDNKYGYRQMLLEKNITVHSHCEHHFVPIIGKCHVAYIPNNKVVGLSKLNRIVRHFSKRPQVQERLTEQIAQALMEALQTKDVAVFIEADHMCVLTRGVEDHGSSTTTQSLHGAFAQGDERREFMDAIKSC